MMLRSCHKRGGLADSLGGGGESELPSSCKMNWFIARLPGPPSVSNSERLQFKSPESACRDCASRSVFLRISSTACDVAPSHHLGT